MVRIFPRSIDCTATQFDLARFNARRLEPQLPHSGWAGSLAADYEFLRLEGEFVDAALRHIAPLVVDVPEQPDDFVAWFEDLRHTGPGQGDPLFPWIAEHASFSQMRWFLEQEVAGEVGFDDLVALTQIKMPQRAKLEMARNYWDEMGRGAPLGMHGPMLSRLATLLDISPTMQSTVIEALALGNLMMALACNRRFAFQSVGALGVIELTAPGRVGPINEGLRRLGLSADARHYFALHATLDVKHSRAWNEEVLKPLVADDSRRAVAIAEGAILRLWCGARCFERYRGEFNLPAQGADGLDDSGVGGAKTNAQPKLLPQFQSL
jgi:hypothetical protein